MFHHQNAGQNHILLLNPLKCGKVQIFGYDNANFIQKEIKIRLNSGRLKYTEL
jgi:hypothetical protein